MAPQQTNMSRFATHFEDLEHSGFGDMPHTGYKEESVSPQLCQMTPWHLTGCPSGAVGLWWYPWKQQSLPMFWGMWGTQKEGSHVEERGKSGGCLPGWHVTTPFPRGLPG